LKKQQPGNIEGAMLAGQEALITYGEILKGKLRKDKGL